MKNKVFWASLAILSLSFYWFQLRPAKIRHLCAIEFQVRADLSSKLVSKEKFEYPYTECLHSYGIQE